MDQQFVSEQPAPDLVSAPLASGVVYTDGQGRRKAALVIGTASSIVLDPPAQGPGETAPATPESGNDEDDDTELDFEDAEAESAYYGHSHKPDLALKPGQLHLSVFSPRGRRYTRYAVPFSEVGAPRTWDFTS